MIWRALILAGALAAAPGALLAQTTSVATTSVTTSGKAAGGDKATDEILGVREKVREAAAKKDRAALEALYADKFNHIRDNGRTDLKRERIDILLSGADAIEIAPDDQMVIQPYGPSTVVASGVSPIKDKRTGKSTDFQWLTVYVRTGDAWQIALSQANRLQKAR